MIQWSVASVDAYAKRRDEPIARVPSDWLDSARAYRIENDRLAAELGRVLLRDFISQRGWNPDRFSWGLGARKKPHLTGPETVHFNMAHSGSMVACVFSTRYAVGIDVERCQPRDLPTFRKVFTPEEQARIEEAADPNVELCRMWTRKEAVAKASGQGVYLPFGTFSVLGESVTVGEETIRWKDLKPPPGYALSVAVVSDRPQVVSRRHSADLWEG